MHQVAVNELSLFQSKGVSPEQVDDLKKQLATANNIATVNRTENDALHKQVKEMEVSLQDKDKELATLQMKVNQLQPEADRAEIAEKQYAEAMVVVNAKNERIQELEVTYLGDAPHSEKTAWARVQELQNWLEKLLIVWYVYMERPRLHVPVDDSKFSYNK